MLETFEGDSQAKRELAARHLEGNGLEFGALHQPLHVDPSRATVSYADRLTKAEALETFPELCDNFAEAIVEPDYIVDLDAGDLSSLGVEAFDFFVANDVIEHLANPLRFLEAVHDVMRPGALFFLSAPDCDFTFDVDRKRTSNRHLLHEYREGIRVVDDDHVDDFIRHSEHESVPADAAERAELFTWHRDRSIHVHVWDQRSFDKFLEFAIARLGLKFTILDRATSREAAGAMVYVLQKQ
jgi:SAM-dependent methyltransferase